MERTETVGASAGVAFALALAHQACGALAGGATRGRARRSCAQREGAPVSAPGCARAYLVQREASGVAG